MKKLSLLVGLAIGFVLGSNQGHEPYGRLEAQVRKLAGRPEIKGAIDAVSDKAADLADPASGVVVNMTGAAQGPISSTDQSEIDAETQAALEIDLAGTFPSSDPTSNWAGPDIEPDHPEAGGTRWSLRGNSTHPKGEMNRSIDPSESDWTQSFPQHQLPLQRLKVPSGTPKMVFAE